MGVRTHLIALLFLTGTSVSHALPILQHASPGSGGTVHRAPSRIVLSFSQALVPSATDAVVRDASGGIVSLGKPRVISKAGEMEVPVKPLPPGKYRVEWYATSTDKRHTQGSYNFVVSTGDGIQGRRRIRR